MKSKSIKTVILSLCSLATVLGIYLLVSNIRLLGDDLWYYTFLRHDSKYFFDQLATHYIYGNGRLFVHTVLAFFLAFDNLLVIQIINSLMLIVMIIFIVKIVKQEKQNFYCVFLTSTSLFLIIGNYIISDSYLWLSGSFNYVFPIMLLLRKTLVPNKLFSFAKASLTSFFLCAWFLVPFIDSSLSNETAVTQRDYVLQDCNTYLFQLFNIFPSADGLSHITYKHNSITSISIGLPLIVGIVCVVYYLYTSKKESKKNVVLTFSLSLVALFLTSNLFPWYLVQQYFGKIGELIRKIQFPWRFMSIATILLIAAVVICFKELRSSNKNIYLNISKCVIISIVLSIGFFNYNFSISTSNRELYDLYNRSFSTISNGEYLLEGTDYESLKSALPYSSGGDTIIESYKKQNGIAVIHCSNISESTSEIELPILAYDNYCAVDTSTKNQFRLSTGDNNRISITLPPNYSGEIVVRFVSPWYWRVAECISMLSVIVIVLFSVIRKIKSRKKNNEKNSKSYCI